MTDTPKFKKGDAVRLRSTKEFGQVERDPVLDMGEYWYRIRFDKRADNVVEEDLEPLDDTDEPLQQITARGSWGKLRAFRTALTVERITNTDQSTLYTFRAQRILFQAFQYKPLLKILESPDRRLLIADEVGLGKTVEAGLILTELEARQPLDRVLVICPSRLREKWRDELSRKFGQDFDIASRGDLEEYLTRLARNPGRTRLRAIVSMQTLRSTDIRERLQAEVGYVDLLIVDEAHHARNPSAQTAGMLRDVCEFAGAVLLLTATPLHLGNRDLFTLLQALRPTEFRDFRVFDDRLQRFTGVHEAALLVRSQTVAALARSRAILTDLFESGITTQDRDPLAAQVLRDMEAPPPADSKSWVELERRIQDLHPLSSVLTRTRKRDVQEVAPARRAKVFKCQWTPAEDQAYRKLVQGSGKLGWIDRAMGIGEIQRARQAASCLPAALDAGQATVHVVDEPAEWSDILPPDSLDGLPHTAELANPATPLPAAITVDSKFEKLLELVRSVEREEPGAKLLVFTFFVGTSRYLQRRLQEKGIPALRIAGDVPSNPKRPEQDERGMVMRQFHDDPRIRVLVSTEVGSEGLDFQFCHHLVNYDLPWNPMVVEQRIGRIDRFGQKSPVVNILNLVVEGTVEDRILYRLYDRIGVFRQSMGQLETILGEEMSELQKDYVSGKLTEAEAERRVEEVARAIEERRVHLEELEKNAGNLFGHEEYLKAQLRRVDRLGRFISEKAMLAVIESFLHSHHPAARIWESPDGVYNLHLTDALRREIRDASPLDNPWSPRGQRDQLAFCFDGERAYERPLVELINVSHPFIKAAVAAVRRQLSSPHARSARAVLVFRPGEEPELTAGEYFVLVFSHIVEGLRARRVLETVVWSSGRGGILPTDDGERLLHLVQESGGEWDPLTSTPGLPTAIWDQLMTEARARNRVLREAEKRENAALYLRRRDLLKAEHSHDVSVKQLRLKTARERGRVRVIPAMEGQVAKADDLYQSRLADLERTREVTCRLSDPIAACVVLVTRPDD